VEIVFHKLRVKPAKPTLFGRRGRTLVFGLPGNPVSTLYAFDLYVAPAIRTFRHHPQPAPNDYQGRLTKEIRNKGDRLLLLPCWSRSRGGEDELRPLATHGSADIFSILRADALALIPAELSVVPRGSFVSFRRLFDY
jgi:molybdopterin biosynthesis enzyme